jgi:hypothetical protein
MGIKRPGDPEPPFTYEHVEVQFGLKVDINNYEPRVIVYSDGNMMTQYNKNFEDYLDKRAKGIPVEVPYFHMSFLMEDIIKAAIRENNFKRDNKIVDTAVVKELSKPGFERLKKELKFYIAKIDRLIFY